MKDGSPFKGRFGPGNISQNKFENKHILLYIIPRPLPSKKARMSLLDYIYILKLDSYMIKNKLWTSRVLLLKHK